MRPYGTPIDCEDVGWEHHWLPMAKRGVTGQVCATCDMWRLPNTPEQEMRMRVENAEFILRARSVKR